MTTEQRAEVPEAAIEAAVSAWRVAHASASLTENTPLERYMATALTAALPAITTSVEERVRSKLLSEVERIAKERGGDEIFYEGFDGDMVVEIAESALNAALNNEEEGSDG